ncbi:MAG: 50S ribosomal protein L18 [bacterium]
MKKTKESIRLKRHRRIRLKMRGTEDKPRLVVRRSLKNMYVQIIDDAAGKSVFSLSSIDKETKKNIPSGGNVKEAGLLGEFFARRVKEKGITKIIFDRAGYLYHGRIKAFAEGLRKGGLEF